MHREQWRILPTVFPTRVYHHAPQIGVKILDLFSDRIFPALFSTPCTLWL